MGASELSTELWRQRELLEQLLFKFEEERLLLVAARSRWIPHATREIETVISRLQESSLALSTTIAETAGEWGLPHDASLHDMVAAAPTDAWNEVLASHVQVLTELTAEVTAMQADNTRLLRAALQAAHETLNLAIGPEPGYDAFGSPIASAPAAHLVDTNF